MILSSADILRILGSNELIRLSASVDIVDSKPLLSGKEGVYIHINRFPSLREFEATWDIWIEADEELDLVLAEMRRILPRMEVVPGLLTLVTTTEFRSESTQRAPEGSSSAQAQIDLSSFEDRFQSLVEDVQDRMLLISSGRAGKNGKDGRDGVDGRDGKDLAATEAELFDLKDVDQSILPMEKGQVLTWDGAKWTNLYVRQTMSAGGAAGVGTNTPVEVLGTTIQWRYHSTAHEIEPDPGDFHTDNADGELATVLHVSKTNSQNTNVELLVGELLSQGYSRIYLSQDSDPSQAHLYAIDSYVETLTGYEISVTHIQTGGTEPDFIQPRIYSFLFLPATAADLDVGNLWTTLGVTPGSLDMGTFTGTTIPDSSTVKESLQALETAHESHVSTVATEQGIQDGRLNTIEALNTTQDGRLDGIDADQITQDNRLTALENADITTDQRVSDLITLSGMPANSTDNGAFTNNIIQANSTTKAALQQLEQAIADLPATLQATPYVYLNNNTTTPAAGRISFDTNTFASVATVYLNKVNNINKDLSNVIPELTAAGMVLYIQLDPSATSWVSFDMTADAVLVGDVFQFAVSYRDSGGSAFANNAKLSFGIVATPGGGGGGGVPEAPQDGNYYVRQNGTWVNLADALTALNDRTIDGGDFITGTSAGDDGVIEGGVFT